MSILAPGLSLVTGTAGFMISSFEKAASTMLSAGEAMTGAADKAASGAKKAGDTTLDFIIKLIPDAVPLSDEIRQLRDCLMVALKRA